MARTALMGDRIGDSRPGDDTLHARQRCSLRRIDGNDARMCVTDRRIAEWRMPATGSKSSINRALLVSSAASSFRGYRAPIQRSAVSVSDIEQPYRLLSATAVEQ